MGLDLLPLGKPKPGFEKEWERAMKPLYSGGQESPNEYSNRIKISLLPYQVINAPRVGHDKEADDWMLKHKPKDEALSDEEFLEKNKDYYVIELLVGRCDGIPVYSNGGLYAGVDNTCFRGQFLNDCMSFLGEGMLAKAWTNCMTPQQVAAYGKELLKISTTTETIAPIRKGIFKNLFGIHNRPKVSIEEQRDILSAAGRWYVFWGSRGHPIAAYF
jgi:hypothetical protein